MRLICGSDASNDMGELTTVIPGRCKASNPRCAIAHRGISRFSDVQLHIEVRADAPRNDILLLIYHRRLPHVREHHARVARPGRGGHGRGAIAVRPDRPARRVRNAERDRSKRRQTSRRDPLRKLRRPAGTIRRSVGRARRLGSPCRTISSSSGISDLAIDIKLTQTPANPEPSARFQAI